MPQNQKLTLLKKYFKEQPSVVMAFLFGSRAQGIERKSSDWDIGIYLKESKDIDKIKNKIWEDVEDILEKEVDLILLNESPSLISSRIIREGIPLAIKNRNIFLDFLIRITEEAEYFRDFFHDYYKIYQRSASLNEIDKARLEKIVVFIESEIIYFSKFKKISFDEYEKEHSIRGELERWIENLMNSTLDMSKIILASEKKPIPETYKKIVLEASMFFGFEKEFSDRLSEWMRLRNILAHEYLDIRWKDISDFLKNGKPYLEKFLRQVKKVSENGKNNSV